MDFHLTREQELVRQMMHDFTENEVKPIAAETDKTSTYPRENIEKLFDLGVMGMVVPEEFGGAGADDLSSAIAIEELSKQCASTGDPQWSVLRPDHCKRYSRTEGEVPPHADRRPQGRCFRTDRAGRWF